MIEEFKDLKLTMTANLARYSEYSYRSRRCELLDYCFEQFILRPETIMGRQLHLFYKLFP